MKTKTRTSIVNLAIALSIVGILVWLCWLHERHQYLRTLYLPVPMSERFVPFAIATIFVIGCGIDWSQQPWRKIQFWMATCPVLIVFVALQWRLFKVPVEGALFGVILVLELILFVVMGEFLPHVRRRRRKERHQDRERNIATGS